MPVVETLRRAAARIAAQEFWLLWVYGAPLLFASNLPSWVWLASLLTIPIFWIARRVTRGAWTRLTPLDLPIVLLLGLGIWGAALSNDRTTSALVVLQFAAGSALYYGVVNGLASSRIDTGVWVLLALGLGFALLGALGVRYYGKFLPFPSLQSVVPRIDVSFLNPGGFTDNVVAGALVPLALLGAGFAGTQTRGRRVVVLLGACFLTAVVLLTQSRGALLGMALGGGVLLLWRAPRRVWLAVGIAAALVVTGIFLFAPSSTSVVQDLLASASRRLELWERGLYILRDFPFTGIGPGTFEQNGLTLYPLFLNSPGEPQPHVHNLFLQMGVDYGVGGLIAFVALATSALGVGIGNVRRLRANVKGWLAAGLLAALVAFLVHSFVDAIFVSTKVSVGIWMILSLSMVLRRVHE